MKIDTDHTMSVLMFIDSYENKMEPKYMITGFCWKDIIFAGGYFDVAIWVYDWWYFQILPGFFVKLSIR